MFLMSWAKFLVVCVEYTTLTLTLVYSWQKMLRYQLHHTMPSTSNFMASAAVKGGRGDKIYGKE